MIRAATLLVALLACGATSADTMRFVWDAVPDAARYRLFYSTTAFTGIPPGMNAGGGPIRIVDTVGNAPEHDLLVEPNIRYWVCVKAIRGELFSQDCSDIIDGLPEPVIESVRTSSIQTPTGREIEVVVLGRNFTTQEQTLYVGEQLAPLSLLVTATQYIARYRYAAGAVPGWVDVIVANNEGLSCRYEPAHYAGCVSDRVNNAFELVMDVEPANVQGVDRR